MRPFFLFLFFAGVISVQAQTYSTENGYAKFNASTSLAKYDGETNKLSGEINLDTKEIHFSVPVESIKTGIGKRDRDMYKLLEVEEYPTVKFEGTLVSDFDPDSGRQKATASGKLTIRNVTKDITIDGYLEKTMDGLHLEATWELLLSTYNIERPSVFFTRVNDEHEIQVNAMLKEAR